MNVNYASHFSKFHMKIDSKMCGIESARVSSLYNRQDHAVTELKNKKKKKQ